MAYREKLTDELERLADIALAEQGKLAFRDDSKVALSSLLDHLIYDKGWITDAAITGPYEGTQHKQYSSGEYYLLEIKDSDMPRFAKEDIPTAKTALSHRVQRAKEIKKITSAEDAMGVLNFVLEWQSTGTSLIARLDYQSPINLLDVVKYFPIGGLFEISHDDRTQQRVLSLSPVAVERLGKNDFKYTSIPQPTNVVTEPEKKTNPAIEFLNAKTSEGKFHFTWKNSLHLPKTPARQGMQSCFTFSDKGAAEDFCREYLEPAGAQKPIVEPALEDGKHPITGYSQVVQSSSKWHIFLLKEDILRLKTNGLDEARRWCNQYGIG